MVEIGPLDEGYYPLEKPKKIEINGVRHLAIEEVLENFRTMTQDYSDYSDKELQAFDTEREKEKRPLDRIRENIHFVSALWNKSPHLQELLERSHRTISFEEIQYRGILHKKVTEPTFFFLSAKPRRDNLKGFLYSSGFLDEDLAELNSIERFWESNEAQRSRMLPFSRLREPDILDQILAVLLEPIH